MASRKEVRRVPLMKVASNDKYTHEHLLESETFIKAVYYETVNGIEDAITNNNKIAILFLIGNSDAHVEINKPEWEIALQSCIEYYSQLEEYELCVKIKKLMDKIK